MSVRSLLWQFTLCGVNSVSVVSVWSLLCKFGLCCDSLVSVVSVRSLLWQFGLCCVSSVPVVTVCQCGHKHDKFLKSIPCVWPATVERCWQHAIKSLKNGIYYQSERWTESLMELKQIHTQQENGKWHGPHGRASKDLSQQESQSWSECSDVLFSPSHSSDRNK